MASQAKTIEKTVEFYGTVVPESTASAGENAISAGSVKAATEYTVESGANKGAVRKYSVTISKDEIAKRGGEDRAESLGEIDEDGNLQVAFTNLEASGFDGALALVGGNEEKVWDMFNRSFNMSRRQNVRNDVLSKLEGPQKAMNSAVEDLVKMGFPRELAEATVAELAAKAADLNK